MKLRLRLLLLIIASFFRERLSLTNENILNLRVLPNDVDITKVSSDRYLPLMDLGRVNIVLRAGILMAMFRKRWIPLARVATIRYRYPLKLFQKYQLRSRIIYWDNEWIWTKHQFERNGRTIAIGITKVTFLGPNGIVPNAEVVVEYGQPAVSPPLPKLVADLQNIEEQIREEQK